MLGNRHSRFLVFLLLAATFGGVHRSGLGQGAFEELSLFVAAGDRLNAPVLLEGWELSQFAAGGFATSFYLGELQVGVQHLFGRALPGVDTDVRLFFLHMGWGPTVELPLGVRWSSGVDVGQVFMRFPQETISFRQTEGEVAYGARTRLSVPVAGGLAVDVGVTWFHVFTSVPIDMTTASVGLRYSFDSPGWLRGFLE